MKPTVYKSKLSWGIIIPLFLLLGTVLFICIYNQVWAELFILLPATGFVCYTIFSIRYTVSHSELHIRCGFLYNQLLRIETIKKITETNNPISSPASSLDRLQISYNKYDTVLISPANKEAFIEELLALNPSIVVKRKP